MIEIIMLITSLFSFNFIENCTYAEDKPIGTPRECSFQSGEVCCEWRYVIDRYCAYEDSECTPYEKANDSMDALRAQENWCWKPFCGWLLNGEGYYTNWSAEKVPSADFQRSVRLLVINHKFHKAKREAKKALKHLIKIGDCETDEPCDDMLEFVIHASRKELKMAAREWRESEFDHEDEDNDYIYPTPDMIPSEFRDPRE
jgi:hypothetical protein